MPFRYLRLAALALAISVLAAVPFPRAAPAQEAGSPVYDYVILVDISGSMIGLPEGSGNAVIFPQVTRAIAAFISDLPDGSRMKLIPFSGAIDDGAIRDFTVSSDLDRRHAISYLNRLQATGQVTWLYNAIDRGLTELAAMRGGDGLPHIQSLFIYTDAKGNGPDDLALDALLDRVDAARADQPHLYVRYVSLGVPVPNAAALQARGIEVSQDPSGAVSPVYEVRVAPAAIELGTLPASGIVDASIALGSNAVIPADPAWLAIAGDLPPGTTLEPTPSWVALGDESVISFHLAGLSQTTEPGVYRVELRLETDNPDVIIVPRSIPLSFTVAPPPPTVTPSPSPVPTPIPTPVPTPTPLPPSVIDLPPAIDLGSQALNLDDAARSPHVSFVADVPVAFSDTGGEIEVAVGALDAGALGSDPPVSVFLLDREGRRVPALRLDLSQAEIPLRAVVDAAAWQSSGGSGRFPVSGELRVRAIAGQLTVAGAPVAGATTIPFQLAIDAFRPFDWRPALMAAIAAALLAVLVGAFPRLPSDAVLSGEFDVADPRGVQRNRPFGFLFGGSIVLGSPRLPLELPGPLARLRGGWGWPKRATLEALTEGVLLNAEPLPPGRGRRLRPRDELMLAGRPYLFGRASAAEAAAAGDDAAPRRRRRFGRRGPAPGADLDELAVAGDALGDTRY